MSESKINCPNCGTSIDVQDIISHQLEEEIKQKYQAQLVEEKKKYESEFEVLNKAKEDFEKRKKHENQLFQERLEKQLRADKKELEENLSKKMKREQADQFDSMQKELNEKSEKLKELNRSKAEIEKLKKCTIC